MRNLVNKLMRALGYYPLQPYKPPVIVAVPCKFVGGPADGCDKTHEIVKPTGIVIPTFEEPELLFAEDVFVSRDPRFVQNLYEIAEVTYKFVGIA